MNLCFVGCGSIAEDHVRAFRRIEGVCFHTVVGRRAEPTESFARAEGFRHSTLDLAEALSHPGIDAVVIASPSDLHEAQTLAALRAGKHVLTELPLATSYEGAVRAVAAAEAAGRSLMVAHTHRFDPALQEVRRRVVSGGLHVYHAVCRWFLFRRENVNWKGKRRSWADNLLWHHGCEALDAVLSMLNTDAELTHARLGPLHDDLGIPMDLHMTLETKARQLISIVMSYNSHMPLHEYFLIGNEETLKVQDGRLYAREGILFHPGDRCPVLEQDREFVAALREGREACVSGRAALQVMRLLQQAQERNR